ncbi:MAG: GGDEF and EAL domain-containing protein [Acetatifactor sp.]|nr:GGDEF and EAL domain-containing protein [Acetatifactor sp.]
MRIEIPEDAKRRLDSLFEAFAIVAEGKYVYLCDLDYDYSRWSSSAVDAFGLPDEYMYEAGGIWENYIHPEDRDAYRISIEEIFSGQSQGHDMQYRARKRDGEYVVCTCRGVVIRDPQGKPKYFGGAIRNQGIHANIDTLTGLRNLYGFFEDLKIHIDRETPVNIIMIGISNFTEINEMYGYHFGNLVLQKFGRYLMEFVANNGCVYRMDGTKFGVISSSKSIETLKRGYQIFRERFQRGFKVDDVFLSMRLNAGLLELDNFEIDDQTAYACLNFSYGESKIRRQGEPVEFSMEMTEGNQGYLEKIQVIRNSIVQDCKGFYLLYQPVVSAATEKLVGAEALLRWKNDTYGMVPPDTFVPVLERDALFPKLGQWILRKALQDGMLILEKQPDFVVNVNLSYSQLERPDFVDIVNETLQEVGFPAKNLCLEITERCKLLDMSLLRNVIVSLRAKGVRFALDDFGTGFSSLSIARELPFDTIKIDRSFVSSIESDEKERELMSHFTKFAASFGSGICVEGIETTGMRDILQKFAVSTFQGYFYSKPITLEELLNSDFLKTEEK